MAKTQRYHFSSEGVDYNVMEPGSLNQALYNRPLYHQLYLIPSPDVAIYHSDMTNQVKVPSQDPVGTVKVSQGQVQ